MKYTDNLGEEKTLSNILELRKILNQSYKYWLEGTGDTAIHTNDKERIVFFRIKEGFFIMQHPDYLAPKINNDKVIIYKHFVGGQEMKIPSTCICDENQAYEILKDFVIKGELSKEFLWFDFYEDLEE